MKTRHALFAAALAGFLVGRAAADVRLSGVFADHVVLQRNQPVPIWGWAEPGEGVTVEFAGQAKQVAARCVAA